MTCVGNAGLKNHYVAVYEDTKATNSDGQRVETESLLYSRWAHVLPISGREAVLAQQTQAGLTHRVRIDYDDTTKNLTPKNWFKLPDGTRLDITRIFDVEMRAIELEAECKQRF